MYESFYGLKEKPFSLLPDPAFLYLSKQHEMAFTLLEYSLENQAGFCVITGKAGTGKTTLLRRLLNQIGDDVSIGLITNAHHSFGELLRWILHSFNLDDNGQNRARQHQDFVDFLIRQYAKNRRTMLIIDEAQCMSPEALEELRMLSNINSEKDLLLQVILVGQPLLRDVLRRPELEQFAQRVAMDYHLESLSGEETRSYIRHRLRVAGGERELFTDDACETVFLRSGGIPRLINLLCDTALVYAYAGQAAVVTGELIEQVVSEREQHGALPVFSVNPASRTGQRLPKSKHASTTMKRPGADELPAARRVVAPRLVGESGKDQLPVVRSESASKKQKKLVTPERDTTETNVGLAVHRGSVMAKSDNKIPLSGMPPREQVNQVAARAPVSVKEYNKRPGSNAHEVLRDGLRVETQSSVSLAVEPRSEHGRAQIGSVSLKKDIGEPHKAAGSAPGSSGAPLAHKHGNSGRIAGHSAAGRFASVQKLFPAMAIIFLISVAFFAWRFLDQEGVMTTSAGNAAPAHVAETQTVRQEPLEAVPTSASSPATQPTPNGSLTKQVTASPRDPETVTVEQARLKQIESERDAALAIAEAVAREGEAVRKAARSRERALAAEHEIALAQERERADQLTQAAEKAKQQALAAKAAVEAKAAAPAAPPSAVKVVESSSSRLGSTGLAPRFTEIEVSESTAVKETTTFTANPCKGPSARFLSTCE